MKTTPIVDQLRRFAPLLQGRVAGAAELLAAQNSANLLVPHAFVVMTGDDPGESRLQKGTLQVIRDTFEVVVALPAGDARGQKAADEMHDVRRGLFLALVGWSPADGYEPIEYGGVELISLDRSRAWYRFEFSAEWTLGGGGEPETWLEDMLDKLPSLEGVDVNVDAIDPMADPNLKKPGPDGRIEAELHIELEA